MTNLRALLIYADVVRRDKDEASNGRRGPPIDHAAAERRRRAEAYARRVQDVLDVIGVKRFPYEDSRNSRGFEKLVRKATIFDAVE